MTDEGKTTRRDIRSDHRFGHAAPSDAGEKQGVFRTEISKTPGFRTDDAEIAARGGLRPVRQDQLYVIAGSARRDLTIGCDGAATGMSSTPST